MRLTSLKLKANKLKTNIKKGESEYSGSPFLFTTLTPPTKWVANR